MRVSALHPDVLVATSAVWQTTCTLVRGGEGTQRPSGAGTGATTEGFVVDSPVLPAELESLAALAAQAGFPVSGLLATHADWDHLLGRLAFPDAALGCAETTAARLTARPGEAQR
ncbi:MAG: MBL fold metallo-hydrolase, partial [Actinomycetota bacterium]|nr:MBL fold metallo-hydrolase [Actinomycetota bacterium]